MARLDDNITFGGSCHFRTAPTGVTRAALTEEELVSVRIPLENFRVFDAYQTALGTAASDDLGITAGTFGTAVPYITAGDVKAGGTITRRGRTVLQIPSNFVDGHSLQLNAYAGVLTTVADTSCTIDFEIYLFGASSLISGSDLVTTAATTINSTTFAEKTFAVTSSALARGDMLDIRMTIVSVDGATATAVTPAVVWLDLQLDTAG